MKCQALTGFNRLHNCDQKPRTLSISFHTSNLVEKSVGRPARILPNVNYWSNTSLSGRQVILERILNFD